MFRSRRHPSSRQLASIAAVALAAAASSCGNGSAHGRPVAESTPAACGPAIAISELDPVLGEASGIARDPVREDLLWLHNDSRNEALLHAVDTTGALVGAVRISGIENRDMEDIAFARCGSEWCVFLGDIGDNRGRRGSVRVHMIPAPGDPRDGSRNGASNAAQSQLTPLASWELVYPDGPRDAEGLIIDDERHQLGIISKGREGEVVLYGLPLEEARRGIGAPTVLRRVGRLAIPVGVHSSQLITAAELDPDRGRLAVRSYTSLYLFPWSGVFEQDTALVPESASLFGALEPQGEGVTWSTDGSSLYLASEGRAGRPPQLSRIRCPNS